MAESRRKLWLRPPKQEQEIHIVNNPLEEYEIKKSSSQTSISSRREQQREILSQYDYQAPLTSESLRPNSRWLTIRRNLHRIRFMGLNNLQEGGRLPDFYLGFQMTRELKRAQVEIKNIDKNEDFHHIKHFSLINNNGTTKIYNTSHVTPDDALIYDRLGEEPLALQNLLFYFSKQNVQHGSLFWNFLYEVNNVLKLKRKRKALVKRLRRIAFTLAIIFYSFIGLMFSFMVISVITTATKFNDPEVEWISQTAEEFTDNTLSLRLLK